MNGFEKFILKLGVPVWNKFRDKFTFYSDLSEANFVEANLSRVNFMEMNLRKANFKEANLLFANFLYADLRESNLENARLTGANLNLANLAGANVQGVDFLASNFYSTNLFGLDLANTDLGHANFIESNLQDVNFAQSNISYTNFSNVDLSQCKGLDKVVCDRGPANIGHATLIKSKELFIEQPEVFNKFLEICGVPQQFIDYFPSLIESLDPIQYYESFISYGGGDIKFVERLRKDLMCKKVQCWFAPADAIPGKNIKETLKLEINNRDKLILVLSKNSIDKPWVVLEAKEALRQEERRGNYILIPIMLDDAIFRYHGPEMNWVNKVRERFIGDFIDCENDDVKYQTALDRLLISLQKDRVELAGSV